MQKAISWHRAFKHQFSLSGITIFPMIYQRPFLNQFSSVQSHSCVWLFATPWTATRQASLSITNTQSLLKFMSIESMMHSNHLVLCHPLLLLISVFPSLRVFSNESVFHIRWPEYWSFSFGIGPSNEHSGLISLLSKGLSRVFSNTTVQKHQFFNSSIAPPIRKQKSI